MPHARHSHLPPNSTPTEASVISGHIPCPTAAPHTPTTFPSPLALTTAIHHCIPCLPDTTSAPAHATDVSPMHLSRPSFFSGFFFFPPCRTGLQRCHSHDYGPRLPPLDSRTLQPSLSLTPVRKEVGKR